MLRHHSGCNITNVIARLDRATQHSEALAMEARSRGVLDAPLSRSMTVFVPRQSGSLAVSEDAND
jgi:hypothetical protein